MNLQLTFLAMSNIFSVFSQSVSRHYDQRKLTIEDLYDLDLFKLSFSHELTRMITNFCRRKTDFCSYTKFLQLCGLIY